MPFESRGSLCWVGYYSRSWGGPYPPAIMMRMSAMRPVVLGASRLVRRLGLRPVLPLITFGTGSLDLVPVGVPHHRPLLAA